MSGDLTWYTVRLTETCAAKVCTPLCSVPTFRFGGPECMIILGHFLLFFWVIFQIAIQFNMVPFFFGKFEPLCIIFRTKKKLACVSRECYYRFQRWQMLAKVKIEAGFSGCKHCRFVGARFRKYVCYPRKIVFSACTMYMPLS